jgi:RNA polymerase sigma-70 factor, ECF subfamily
MKDDLEYAPSVRIPASLRRIVDADDLRQSMMLRFYLSGSKFRWRSDAERRAYLHRLLVSVLIDELRRERRGCRSGRRVAVVLGEVPADWTSPSRKAIRNERQARLVEAIAAIPADQRMAVTLVYLQGRTLTEAAQIMGKTVWAVAGLLRRALVTLRKQLAEYAEV